MQGLRQYCSLALLFFFHLCKKSRYVTTQILVCQELVNMSSKITGYKLTDQSTSVESLCFKKGIIYHLLSKKQWTERSSTLNVYKESAFCQYPRKVDGEAMCQSVHFVLDQYWSICIKAPWEHEWLIVFYWHV